MRSIRQRVVATLLTTLGLSQIVSAAPPIGSGFSLPKEDEAFTSGLDDFARYCGKKQWDAACRAVSKILDQPPKGFISDDDGVMLPGRQRLRQVLLTLPADGLAAYRLFFDAQAKKLFDDAVAAGADDTATLRRVVDGFLQTGSGALAADRLGDAEFEAGNFAAADAQWKLLLDHLPDAPTPPARLLAKRGIALARLGRQAELGELAKVASAKYANDAVEIGGRSQNLVAFLNDLHSKPATAPSTTARPELSLTPTALNEAWQSVFMTDATAEEFRSALQNTGWWRYMNGPESTVPAADVDGRRAYVNWMGIVFAVDLKTGKLLWRTEKFSKFKGQGMQVLQGGTDATDYAIAAVNDRVYAVGTMPTNFNGMASVKPLRCLNAETGKPIWSTQTDTANRQPVRRTVMGVLLGSTEAPSTPSNLSAYNFCGSPVVNGNTLYAVAAPQGQAKLELLAIDADKGGKLWSIALGSAATGQNFRGQAQLPRPQLRLDNNTLYVLTNNGALLAVDLGERSVRWAIRTDAPPIMDTENMVVFSDDGPGQKVEPPGDVVISGGRVYLKESATRLLYAIDPAGPKLLWKRPLETEIGIAAARDGRLVTTGAAAEAIDGDTRALVWSTPLAARTGQMRPVFGDRRMLVQSSRGIFLIDTDTGDVLNIFRSTDRDAIGADLHVSGDLLVSVSNRAITAYRLSDAPVDGPAK